VPDDPDMQRLAIDAGLMLLNRRDSSGLEWKTMYWGNLMVLAPRSWDLPGSGVRLEWLADRSWLGRRAMRPMNCPICSTA
tara:strand:- start:5058 stop:5297 length:240 start_codon:yes stop_codon:yes gene_type:complete